MWSAIIRINTEGKSLIMKLGPGCLPEQNSFIFNPQYWLVPGTDSSMTYQVELFLILSQTKLKQIINIQPC